MQSSYRTHPRDQISLQRQHIRRHTRRNINLTISAAHTAQNVLLALCWCFQPKTFRERVFDVTVKHNSQYILYKATCFLLKQDTETEFIIISFPWAKVINREKSHNVKSCEVTKLSTALKEKSSKKKRFLALLSWLSIKYAGVCVLLYLCEDLFYMRTCWETENRLL